MHELLFGRGIRTGYRPSTRFEFCPREIYTRNLCVPVRLSAWNTPPLANSKAEPQKAARNRFWGVFSDSKGVWGCGAVGLNFAQNNSPALRKSIFWNYILGYNLAERRRKALAEVPPRNEWTGGASLSDGFGGSDLDSRLPRHLFCFP